MAQQNTLDFLVAAHVSGQEQMAKLINTVGALQKETERLKTANAGLAASTDTVIRNGKRYNNELDAQAKALKNQRQGTQQLGMQFNDLATSISTGASPIQAFNQQLGQMGYALSMMEGRLGAVGTFLMGPWGTALQIAIMALGFFADKLLFTEDSSKKAKSAISDLGQQFNFAAMSAEDLARVNELLAQTNSKMAQTAYQAANATAAQANANAAAVASTLDLARAKLFEMRVEANKVRTNLDETLDPMQASVAEQFMQRRVDAQTNTIKQLEAALDGFQYASRRAAGQAYALASGMDASSKAAERHSGKLNILQNLYAAGKISAEDFRREVDATNKVYAKAMAEIEAANKKGGGTRKPPMTDAMRDAKKLADATARWTEAFPGEGINKASEVYDDYRIMMIKSTEASNKRMSELDDEMARNNIDRAAQMAKEIGYIVEAGNQQQAEQITKPYEALQNSFQAIGQTVSDAFKGMITGATSWKDAMRGIINSVIDQLWQLYVVQQIVGFVTKALGKVGAPLPGPVESVSPFMKAANGTINSPGGLTWVGERGPELVNLPRGSQVIPAHRAQSMGGSGVTVNVDARGSSDPAAVRAQVQQGIMEAAPAIIAAAQARTVNGLRRPRLGGAMQ